ncbi:MAG TPA: hypothetical protein VNL15_08805 [Dehalococcoidia bacterium]|nr:hypothetical protein [Dehalococcoidia bacterium]
MTTYPIDEDFKHRRFSVLALLDRIFSSVYILWIMPVVIIGGIFLSVYGPHWLESFYLDTAMPFLITFWIGAGFAFTWRIVRQSMHQSNAPLGLVAAVGVLSALVLLSMLGGISILWEDPWLFGIAVVPGFEMALPLLQRWLGQACLSPGRAGRQLKLNYG